MVIEFDDELAQMDEREMATDPGVHEAVSLQDPLSSLDCPQPVVVSSGTTIEDAVKRVQSRSLGCVLVVEDGELSGILTERDILQKITGKGLNFTREIVDDYMTPNPEYLKMQDPVAYALNKMTVGGFRHVPIVDDEKQPVGMVSLVDIVSHIANYFGDEILNLPAKPQRKALSRPEGG